MRREIVPADGLDAAAEAFDMNHARSGFQGYGDHAYHQNHGDEGDRLASLKRTVESIEKRLAGSAAAYQANPHGQQQPHQNQHDMQLALADIAGRQTALNAVNAPRMAPQHHQRARNPIRTQQPDRETLKGIEAIGRHLGDLKREIADIKSTVAEVPQSEIDRIANAIAELQRAESVDEDTFAKLAKELDDMRANMKFDMQKAVRSELEHSHNADTARLSQLEERLDVLGQGLDALSRHAAGDMTPRVEGLAQQLDAMRTSLDDLPQTLAISRLEDRLAEVADKVEMSLSAAAMQLETLERPNSSALDTQALTSIESRLDEISRALVAVSNMGSKRPQIDMSAVDRVEARLSELARTVDQIAAARSEPGTDDEMQKLAVRIEGLTDRLGSFEEYARSGDLGAANAMFSSPDTGVIEEQLRRLNDRLDDVDSPPQLNHLEKQLQNLHSYLEEAADKHSTAEQISGLESQLTRILDQLDQPMQVAAQIDTEQLEARLAEIESHLANSQSLTLQAAQEAARQAVEMMGPQSDQGEIISALSDDLRSLQDLAESGSVNNERSARAVQESLEQVIDRLASIESSMDERPAASANPAMPKAVSMEEVISAEADKHAGHEDQGPQVVGPIHQAALASGFVGTPSAEVDAPALDPVDDLEAAIPLTEEEPEDHQPLEPGSDAPDLDRLVEQASARLKVARKAAQEHAPADSLVSPEVKPNVVEAARRAVRHAEARNNQAEPDESSKSAIASLKARLAQLRSGTSDARNAKEAEAAKSGSASRFDMQTLRKPVVLAVAVVLLSLIGLKGVQMFVGSDAPVEVVESRPAVEQPIEQSAAGIPAGDAEEPAVRSVQLEEDRQVRQVEEPTTTVVEAQPAPAPMEAPVNEAGPDVAATPAGGDQNAQSASLEVPDSAGPVALVAAAKSGDPKALFHLGMRYSEGNGVARDMSTAVKWFTRSAELDFAPAQYSIGSLYEKGIGVDRDVVKAAGWYEKAAAQGNARAMHNLAVIKAMGNPPEVKPDMTAATEWFLKAADYGIKDSQFNLGILYGQGMGVPQNLSESYKWFALAAKTGDADAGNKRDEVANAMDPEDLATARKVVAEWKPKPLNEETNRMKAPDEWHGRAPDASTAQASSQKTLVMKTQAMLNERGFNVGTPDGLIGPKTQEAIAQFQRDAGLPVTGKVDRSLLRALDIQV